MSNEYCSYINASNSKLSICTGNMAWPISNCVAIISGSIATRN